MSSHGKRRKTKIKEKLFCLTKAELQIQVSSIVIHRLLKKDNVEYIGSDIPVYLNFWN